MVAMVTRLPLCSYFHTHAHMHTSDMLVYNVLSDETIVVADGKETHSESSRATLLYICNA